MAQLARIRQMSGNYKLPYYTLSPTYSICKNHGYLAGEQKVCPHCGEVTEVYSRITGYYRPVQNWNEGKAQEYKNRVLYDIEHSKLHKVKTNIVKITKDEVTITPTESKRYLFTTKRCPNCKVAKDYLGDVDYQIIDAEENADLVKKYNIMMAPTLVIEEGGNARKYVNASNIKKYVDERKVLL